MSHFPATVEDAVDLLRQSMSADQLARITELSKEDLVMEHFGLGQWIRNSFGLWASDSKLLRATGKEHPDDASAMILSALWQDLQGKRRSAIGNSVAEGEGPTSTPD